MFSSIPGVILYTFLHFDSTPAIVSSVVIGLGIVFCGAAVVHNVFVWQKVSLTSRPGGLHVGGKGRGGTAPKNWPRMKQNSRIAGYTRVLLHMRPNENTKICLMSGSTCPPPKKKGNTCSSPCSRHRDGEKSAVPRATGLKTAKNGLWKM